MKWEFWPIAYWIIWVFAFVLWETYAGFENMGAKDIPMLTQAVVRYIPRWITLPFLIWLLIHFTVRYFNPKYMEWLKTRS